MNEDTTQASIEDNPLPQANPCRQCGATAPFLAGYAGLVYMPLCGEHADQWFLGCQGQSHITIHGAYFERLHSYVELVTEYNNRDRAAARELAKRRTAGRVSDIIEFFRD